MRTERNSLFILAGSIAGAAVLVVALLALWLVTAGAGLRPAAAVAAAENTPTSSGTVAQAGDQTLAVGDRPHISVVGTGSVSGKPDILHVQVGVQVQDPSLATAQSNAGIQATAIYSSLLASGVADKDIATSTYSIDPIMSNGDNNQPAVITGYRVTEIFNVTLRDIPNAGKVIDGVAKAGANDIFGLSFDFADPTALTQQARAAAMNDAKSKAQQLAQLAGVTLGAPIVIEETTNTPVPLREGIAAPSASAGAPIVSGEQQVQVQVSVIYGIQ